MPGILALPPNAEIQAFNEKQANEDKATCEVLMQEISRHLSEADSKVWHAHPVWFLNGNPIVGYNKLKDGIRLMFWSGQSFGEPGLKPSGKFKAAEVRYTSKEQIDLKALETWCKAARLIQWDYKNIVKRKGNLERLV